MSILEVRARAKKIIEMRQRNRSLSDFGLLEEIKTEPRPGFRTADQLLLEKLKEQKKKLTEAKLRKAKN